ncbi:MAG: protein kinase domain-containing protein [Myxococcota bacterium]
MDRTEGVLVAGRYRLVRKLGAGGMGAVWLAHDISLDSACALKLIDDEKAQSEEVRVRFEREARAAAQLRGAHVVDVFDHGEWEGTLYIAMEYLQGEDLGARLERVGRLDPASTYRVVAHVARALVRAHANGIVHRDLKPENIFLVQGDEEEIAKVLDFGIAKHDAYSLHDKATRTGSFLGTPFYVSPEQARGKSTDFRSDLWSLGIIVFQCLTGRPPFESEALGELMGLILYEELPRPSARNPELPATLDAWWERAAARDRELRFQSAKELADALGHALGLSRQVAIPSIAPRRPSYADGSGAFPPATASATGSYPPVAAGARMSTPNRLLPSFSDPEWGEERVETDAPVSRTRHSAAPPGPLRALRRGASRWLSRRGAKRALTLVRKLPKRNLVLAAVGSGVLLGVILTLVLVPAEQPQPPLARPATSARPEIAPVSAPVQQPSIPSSPMGETPVISPSQLAPEAPLEAPAASAPPEVPHPADANAPKASVAAPQSDSAPKKKAPVRRRTRGPDYGI